MCGICGVIGTRAAPERIRESTDLMRHRGPDQCGTAVLEGASLGHRRLSIIDLSDAAQQPMSNEDGSVWLVFNGEIYNFAELRHQLESQHEFRSRTDSEVLVHGYEDWGIEGLLARIRGMFGFAIWDCRARTAHLARDHLGKKPLYYSTHDGALSFASTLPALRALLGETPTVSDRSVAQYLTYLSVPAPETIFNGVYKLPAAHRFEFKPGETARLSRYWRPEYQEKEDRSEAEWTERIDEALRIAVRERLVSDVPIGAFLSGGVDSSLVVAIMAEELDRPVTTVSVGFAEKRFNELPYARRVATHCGTDHHEHVLEPRAAEVLPDIVFHHGEPFADHSAVPTYYLAKAARQHATVVLTGDGGDESFGGYLTPVAARVASWLRFLPGIGSMTDGLRYLARHGSGGAQRLLYFSEYARRRQGNYVFDPPGVRTFRHRPDVFAGPLRPSAFEEADALYRAHWEEVEGASWVDRALYVDLVSQLPNTLLTKVDVAAMAWSLEARSPFLDRVLVELAFRIPSRQLIRRLRSKYLLKKVAERYLPREVLYRRKRGFALPVSEWLRSDLRSSVRSALLSDTFANRGYFNPAEVKSLVDEHLRGAADHGRRIWSLLMLELWFLMFVDGQLRRSDDLSDW